MVLAVENLTLEFEGLRALTESACRSRPARSRPWLGRTAPARRVSSTASAGSTPTSGRIVFGGAAIQGLPPHRIAAHGIARTFQFVELFRA